MSIKKSLNLIFCRPLEPAFILKNIKDDRKSKFLIPEKFYTNQYKDLGWELSNRFNDVSINSSEQIIISDINEIDVPQLDFALAINRNDMFSPFIPLHCKIAGQLINIFINCKTIKDLESIAVYCRDRINPYLFVYALSVALNNRMDTKNYELPTLLEIFPEKFIDGQSYELARAEITIVPDGSRIPITVPQENTATHINAEQRCAYFREDFGMNLLYWNWNVRYPTDVYTDDDSINIVNKNRRGELFYYLHEQLLAHYNCERLSNQLYRVDRLNNLRDKIKDGYFPKLNSQISRQTWPPRFENTKLQDLNRTNDLLHCDVSQLERWIERIIDSIEIGYATSKDDKIKRINLNNDSGIDCLGNIIQSTILSPNKDYYGDLCKMGHLFIAYCHDPDNRHLETYGVMGDPATTLRDPVFYRWHAYLLDIFQMHKKHLQPYNKLQLEFSDIYVSNVEIQFQNKQDGIIKNTIHTYWQQTDVDISHGLDFAPKGHIYVRLTHLQHSTFNYKIKIKNTGNAQKAGTIRIFMAPKYDERMELLTFREQRLLMIELDRFVSQIRPGINYIIRRSTESSLTIPMDYIFSPEKLRLEQLKNNNRKFCGCGWPQHMLIPKGTENGMEYVLFVMVSNYHDDYVGDSKLECTDGSSLCGLLNEKYPDARSMGYPFDRPAHDHILYLSDFLNSNMKTQIINIQFLNETIEATSPEPTDDTATTTTSSTV